MARATVKSRDRLVRGTNVRARTRGRRLMRKKTLWTKRRGVTRQAVRAIVKSSLNRRLEKKDITNTNDVTVTNAVQFVGLNEIARGALNGQREGDDVFLKSITGRVLTRGNTTATLPFAIRWGIVMFPEGSSSPLAKDIFDDTTSASTVITGPFRSYDAGQVATGVRKRFKILYDATEVIDMFGSGKSQDLNKLRIKINEKAIWQAGEVSATAFTRNSVYLYFISDITVNQPTMSYYLRTYYTDA